MFANLGFTPEAVTPSIASRKDRLKGVFLFYDDQPDAKKAAADVAAFAKGANVPLHHRLLKTVFDPVDAFREFLATYRSLEVPRSVEFNVAGGPGVLTAAATVFCMALNVPLFYVRRDAWSEGQFPADLYWVQHSWTDMHRAVLGAIRGGKDTVTGVAEGIEKDSGYTSRVVQELEPAGYIVGDRRGREKVLQLAPTTQVLLDAEELRREEAGTVDRQFQNMMRRRILTRTLGAAAEQRGVEALLSSFQFLKEVDAPWGKADAMIRLPEADVYLEVKKHLRAPEVERRILQLVEEAFLKHFQEHLKPVVAKAGAGKVDVHRE